MTAHTPKVKKEMRCGITFEVKVDELTDTGWNRAYSKLDQLIARHLRGCRTCGIEWRVDLYNY